MNDESNNVTIEQHRGATDADWNAADMAGLTEYLLPNAHGKIPSLFGANGPYNMPGWPSHRTTGEHLKAWMADPRLGMCIRLGRLVMIDIDVDDQDASDRIVACAQEYARQRFGRALGRRFRKGSGRTALLCLAKTVMHKRITLDAPGTTSSKSKSGLEEIDVRATPSLQMHACGTHPEGERLQYEGGMFDPGPEITEDQVLALVDHLIACGVAQTPVVQDIKAEGKALQPNPEYKFDPADEVYAAALAQGRVLQRVKKGVEVVCPNIEQHSGEDGGTPGLYFPPGRSVAEDGALSRGAYSCPHAHCVGLSILDLRESLSLPRDPGGAIEAAFAAPVGEPAGEGIRLYTPYEALSLVNLKAPSGPIPLCTPRPNPEQGAVSVIVGAASAGKSLLLSHRAFCMGTGREHFGYAVRRTPVLYVALEGSTDFAQRIAAYLKQYEIQEADGGPVFCFENLAADSGWPQRVSRLARRCAAEYIVIDTWASFAGGRVDENDATTVQRFFKETRECSVLAGGAPIEFAHHTTKAMGKKGNKEAITPRGSSVFVDAPDLVIALSTEGRQATDIRSWTVEKNRGGIVDGRVCTFDLVTPSIGTDADGQEVRPAVLREIIGKDGVPASAFEPAGGRPMSHEGMKTVNALVRWAIDQGGAVNRGEALAQARRLAKDNGYEFNRSAHKLNRLVELAEAKGLKCISEELQDGVEHGSEEG
jgi:hypothetical protein